MEQAADILMYRTESAPENIDTTEPKKKEPRGRGRGRGGRGYVRGGMRGRALNGFGPMRLGMGRMRPYPDARGGRGAHGGPVFPQTPPIRGMMRMPFLPPPPPPPPPRWDFLTRAVPILGPKSASKLKVSGVPKSQNVITGSQFSVLLLILPYCPWDFLKDRELLYFIPLVSKKMSLKQTAIQVWCTYDIYLSNTYSGSEKMSCTGNFHHSQIADLLNSTLSHISFKITIALTQEVNVIFQLHFTIKH
ncbi:hypothetical protein JRQ81_004876 [Phrynocephalus forsythii]|uniref:Uncharacterized protein n=1 Tax=Phrynocephalus forsythii TaxID=171643 RepID=A0A9Q0Y4K2_9SAUR|nr:hypothetical protein JRQ81_004876 [Phrynocephalus forsythii]